MQAWGFTYNYVMAERRPAEELQSFRDFLARLESGELKLLSRSGQDVTESELVTLKRQLSFVDGVLAFFKSKVQSATGPQGPG